MKIHSFNEWDPLRSVVVGRADHANWPTKDPVFRSESERTLWKETPLPSGPVPDWIIKEANEDLDQLVGVLRSLNVEVLRPNDLDFQELDGMYNYCPRDRLFVYGDTIVNPAMMYPCRDMEIECYKDIADAAANYVFMPRHEGMTLDAANIARLNNKWIFLESASGNRAAYDWLCTQFPTVDIELVNFYAGVHIDSTIVPLREGLVLVNGSRVNPENLPRVLKDWEVIYCNHVEEQGFFQYPYASKWIALNMLVVNPHTIIVDKNQPMLIDFLEKNQFTVVPMQLRHSRTLGGGFHCVTLDLHREL
jgi:N-dimethylarginine dimethylaminohydrolase